ncbi:hypothetical protein RHGRI_024940 [Rhododendron griersonianum]|uniref:Secreted protein n=1 Tax=Rhododendron griersonianum TaxID=479676 RepID=A0AAV6JEL5_9ERIC|nr:hypothetical protein RHGRI_024940 [Rhododendron griersonianum]
MKMKSIATLVFFLISLAIFFNGGLARENSGTSIAKQSDGDVVQPEWFHPWGRPFPRGPWGRPHFPRWPIPGHGGALPPLPARKFPPLPPKGSGSDVSNTEQVEIAEQAESTEQDDDVYQSEWLLHP